MVMKTSFQSSNCFANNADVGSICCMLWAIFQ